MSAAGKGGYRKWYVTVRSTSQPDRDAWIITIPKFEAAGGQHGLYQNSNLRIIAESGNRKWAEHCLKDFNAPSKQ